MAVALVLWAGGLLDLGGSDVREVSYSEFLSQLDSGNVADVTIKGSRLRGNFETPITATTESGDTSSFPWMLFLSSALPILLLVAVGIFIFRRMQAREAD